jgi:hypothetical protein
LVGGSTKGHNICLLLVSYFFKRIRGAGYRRWRRGRGWRWGRGRVLLLGFFGSVSVNPSSVHQVVTTSITRGLSFFPIFSVLLQTKNTYIYTQDLFAFGALYLVLWVVLVVVILVEILGGWAGNISLRKGGWSRRVLHIGLLLLGLLLPEVWVCAQPFIIH